MGFLTKLRNNYQRKKASNKTFKDYERKEYEKALFKEKKKYSMERAQQRAKRDAKPLGLKLAEGVKQARKELRTVKTRAATNNKPLSMKKNPALELPKRDLFGSMKSPDELLGFSKKEASELPKKKLKLKKRVVYEYE